MSCLMNNTFKNNYSLLLNDILFSIQYVYWHHQGLYDIQGVPRVKVTTSGECSLC